MWTTSELSKAKRPSQNVYRKMPRKGKVIILTKNNLDILEKRNPVPECTHGCMKNTLTLAMCVGLFPLDAVRCIDPHRLRFRWLSLKILYWTVLFILYATYLILSTVKCLSLEVVMLGMIPSVFWLHVCGSLVIFLKMSRRWPEFINSLHFEEIYLIRKYRSETHLNFKVNLIVIVANAVQLAEHFFSVANVYLSETCVKSSSRFENYVRKQFTYVFIYVDYNHFYGIILVAMDWIAAIIWNFGDIFMVAITTIFTTRFQNLKAKILWHIESPACIQAISYSENGKRDIQFWREVRVDYNRLSKQCEKLNEVLSDTILLSFTCNLGYILIQIFKSLKERNGVMETVYFFSAFILVVVRTAAVSISGGCLNEASKELLPILNTVPTEIYNPEITRLISQIHRTGPFLTGHNLFSVTKGLVLSVAATIITYELVLIQFNQDDLEEYLDSLKNASNCH